MSTPSPELLLSVAHAHHTAGRSAEAESLYQQVLLDYPNHPQALNRFGVLLLQTNRADAAVLRLRKSAAIQPCSQTLSNLGAALRQTHLFHEAVDVLQQAVALDPTLAMAQINLAGALLDADRPADALLAANASVALDPTSADAHINRANALKALNNLDAAIDAYRTALVNDPRSAVAHSNLGVAMMRLGDPVTAIDHYRRAIELDPTYAPAFGNLANALADSGDLDNALLAARRGVQLSPHDIHGHWNLAVVLLSRGDYLAGFEEYEWRFRSAGDTSQARFTMPRWNGETLLSKTIILHAEQGFGDAIQFVRYIPRVAKLGGTVVLECHAELKTLFEVVPGPARVIARGDALPEADFHCPLMSLAHVFGTTLESILPFRFSIPLAPANRDVPKIGLVWAGNPKHKNDARRSIPFEQLSPLLNCEADFVSLQRGVDSPLPSIVGNDFLQTAQQIATLDRVICVDTAVAHLAASMGVPTWILLPVGTDWRWLTGRTDSPWYPTARLFRQSDRDDWSTVIATVADAIKEHPC